MGRKRSNKYGWMPTHTRFHHKWFVYENRTTGEYKKLAPKTEPQWKLLRAYDDFINSDGSSFKDCINAYLASPQFASLKPDTQKKYLRAIATQPDPRTGSPGSQELMYSFGDMQPEDIDPPAIRRVMDAWASMPAKANNMHTTLSAIFQWNIERGHILGSNPCRAVKKYTEKKGGRYVHDLEYKAFFNFLISKGRVIIACCMAIAYLCGSRQQDVLRLLKHRPFMVKYDDCYATKEGLVIYQLKTRKVQLKRFYNPKTGEKYELKKIYDMACKGSDSQYVISNTRGGRYTRGGFNKIWGNMQIAAVEQGILKERFQFHDMKRKAASDVDAERRAYFLGSTESTANRYNRTADETDPVR